MAIKRIVIIFIIVCILLSFVEISCLAQKESHTNYGEAWLKLSDLNRSIMFIGFCAGFDLWVRRVLPMLNSKIKENLVTYEEVKPLQQLLEMRLYITDNPNENPTHNIINAMTELYKDPANTYITYFIMIEIAYQKLKGKNIEPLLREARKEALQN